LKRFIAAPFFQTHDATDKQQPSCFFAQTIWRHRRDPALVTDELGYGSVTLSGIEA
jgi:hypothetical protein